MESDWTPVTENMTTPVKAILRDASVMEAVKNLGRGGYARLPVVDHDGKLVGIVTISTIMMALLREMEVSFQKKEAEKLQTCRASHIFEDITSDNTSLILRYVADHGPGIDNLQQVLQPGYSTAPQWIRDMGFGAGMWLHQEMR